jgi:ferrous iron transport protein A
METTIKLGDLAAGESGRVVGFDEGSKAYRRKLLVMGLTPGTEFTVARYAPMGDPVELRVRGFSLSLRKDEAAALRVESSAT